VLWWCFDDWLGFIAYLKVIEPSVWLNVGTWAPSNVDHYGTRTVCMLLYLWVSFVIALDRSLEAKHETNSRVVKQTKVWQVLQVLWLSGFLANIVDLKELGKITLDIGLPSKTQQILDTTVTRVQAVATAVHLCLFHHRHQPLSKMSDWFSAKRGLIVRNIMTTDRFSVYCLCQWWCSVPRCLCYRLGLTRSMF
jgi:hypothetical protein